MGLLLFIIMFILQRVLFIIFFAYAVSKYLFTFQFKKLDKYFYSLAFSGDQNGNVWGAPLMTDVLLKKEPAKYYGNEDETISHVTGVNYLANKLTKFGKLIAKILNKIDKNHVEKAAKNEQ